MEEMVGLAQFMPEVVVAAQTTAQLEMRVMEHPVLAVQAAMVPEHLGVGLVVLNLEMVLQAQ